MEIRFTTCSVSDCKNNAHRDGDGRKGFCSMHYQRVKKHGDPTVIKVISSPAKDWLIAHVSYKDDNCLQWPFCIGNDGYGRVHYFGNGALTTASRLMCVLAHGEPPSKKHESAHSCGKGSQGCVNPLHLYWATPTTNQRERLAHGTHNRGERQGLSKLTDENVRTIRLLVKSQSQTSVAAMFDIDQSHVSNIVTRKVWAWLV